MFLSVLPGSRKPQAEFPCQSYSTCGPIDTSTQVREISESVAEATQNPHPTSMYRVCYAIKTSLTFYIPGKFKWSPPKAGMKAICIHIKNQHITKYGDIKH
jgi:hypothetical protein